MDFTIPLQLQSNTPIYLQIYEYIKAEIIQGTISVGTSTLTQKFSITT